MRLRRTGRGQPEREHAHRDALSAKLQPGRCRRRRLENLVCRSSYTSARADASLPPGLPGVDLDLAGPTCA